MFIRIEAENVDVRNAALMYNKTETTKQTINIILLNPNFLSRTKNKASQSNIGKRDTRISIIALLSISYNQILTYILSNGKQKGRVKPSSFFQ